VFALMCSQVFSLQPPNTLPALSCVFPAADQEPRHQGRHQTRQQCCACSSLRYFLRQIVNRVVEIKDRKLQDYVGDYNYYLEQNLEARRKELEREAELEAAAPKVKSQSKMTRVRTGQNSRLGSNKLGSVVTCLCCCRLYRALCKAASCTC
jgi:hypothetical protein